MKSLIVLLVVFLIESSLSKKEGTCDIRALAECDMSGADMCGNMLCVLDKLTGCDEATADEVTNSEYATLKETYRTECLPCDTEAAKECGTPSITDSVEKVCKSMDCTISNLEGCDRETLASLAEAPDTSIETFKELRDVMCAKVR